MSQPTHEPPDPELWGRVVDTCYVDGVLRYGLYEVPPQAGSWWLSVGEPECAPEYEGFGKTWNDAARALIAEWEGRGKG